MYLRKDKSVAMSAPEARMLHGVEIKKLPIGRYIRMLQHAETLLPDILTALFPDGKISLGELSADGVQGFVSRALAVVPERLCEVAGDLLGIPRDKLLNPDEGLAPTELAEILIALWEVNDVSDFFTHARRLSSLIGLSALNIGSSAG